MFANQNVVIPSKDSKQEHATYSSPAAPHLQVVGKVGEAPAVGVRPQGGPPAVQLQQRRQERQRLRPLFSLLPRQAFVLEKVKAVQDVLGHLRDGRCWMIAG